MPDVVTEPAPAKINPFLRVIRRREDGFHEIETVILPITLADGIQVVAADELRLRVVGERAGQVPTDDANLVLRAARALRERVGVTGGAHLLLSKKIPVAAGLGGGSADAAATLRALNALWGCGVPVEELAKVGAGVGSDVPALVFGGPVVARGRGELVERVHLPQTWWVLVTDDDGVSSREAYTCWDAHRDEDVPLQLDDLLRVLREGRPTRMFLRNDLERPVMTFRPELDAVQARLRNAGALGVVMSGSGPTVAGLARDAAHADELARTVGGIVVASLGPSGPSG